MRHLLGVVVLLLAPLIAGAQATGGTITGVVTDEGGGVIPGAFVVLRPSSPGAGLVELEVFSDDAGRFEFSNIPAGRYRVAAHLVGFYPHHATITVTPGAVAQVTMLLAVAPMVECVASTRTTLRFQTRSALQLLPAAYLTVVNGGGRARSYSVRTTGEADCHALAAGDHVTLDVAGYGEHVITRAEQDPARVTRVRVIEPTPGAIAGRTPPGPRRGQVRGRVFDGVGGSIPDGTVWFQPIDRRSGLPEFRATADGRGRFDFEAVPTGTYLVTAVARGYAPSVAVHEIRAGVQTEVTLVLREER